MKQIFLGVVLLFVSSIAEANINADISPRFSTSDKLEVERGEILVRPISVTENGYLFSGKAFFPHSGKEFLSVMQNYERYPEFMQVHGSSGLIELEDQILNAKIFDNRINPLTLLGEIDYQLEVFVKLSFIGFSIQEYHFTGDFSASYQQAEDGTIIVHGSLVNPNQDVWEKIHGLTHYWEIFPTAQGTYVYYENAVVFAYPLTEPGPWDFFKPSLETQKQIIRETVAEKIQKAIQNFKEELKRRF